MKNPFRRAFTLIEMLVVVAIIMVLGALLFPALGRAREGGRSARCASNLHQLQLAVMNYGIESGKLPYAESFLHDNGDGTKSHWAGWVAWYDYPNGDKSGSTGKNAWYGVDGYKSITNGTLWNSTKTEDVYLCPTFKFKSVCGQTSPKRSYAMNQYIGGANLMSIQGASATMLFCDDKKVVSTGINADPKCDTNEVGLTWHQGKGNFVYVDGHIERQ